ncbi:tRNA (adenosine(37)-N6)-threonylcarbamoyltransferase complex dimerization subunit type 1 TsaB [Algoriphagus namhaensis]
MSLILCIETSTPVCSVALHQEGKLLSLREVNEVGAHSAQLLGFIKTVLDEAGVQKSNLSAIAVNSGPGSYTGLRIGVSVAKGLAYSLGLPLISVGAMDVLFTAARPHQSKGSKIIPMLDARRDEVYAQVYDESGVITVELAAVILSGDSFTHQLEAGPVYFIGDGVSKARRFLGHPNANFLQESISAKHMGEMAWNKFLRGDFEDIAYFVPNYLKEFKVIKSKKNLFLK